MRCGEVCIRILNLSPMSLLSSIKYLESPQLDIRITHFTGDADCDTFALCSRVFTTGFIL